MADTETETVQAPGADPAPAASPPAPEPAPAPEAAPAKVEDINNLSNVKSVAELAKLDETDSVLAATIRSQMNWAKEAPAYFKEEDAETLKRQKLLDELGAIDAENARQRKAEEEAKAKADELARVDELIAAQQAIVDDCASKAAAARDEIKRLNAVKKAG